MQSSPSPLLSPSLNSSLCAPSAVRAVEDMFSWTVCHDDIDTIWYPARVGTSIRSPLGSYLRGIQSILSRRILEGRSTVRRGIR